MGLHAIDEAKRCLNCKKPRCMEGCPIHTPIPAMIRMFLDGQMTEGAQMVKHEETERFVPADSIIISISQGPQDRIVNRDKELKVDGRGLLKTNEKGETTMKGIFASGDVVTGAKTVVEAVKCSKMIADAMDEYVKASLSSSSSS